MYCSRYTTDYTYHRHQILYKMPSWACLPSRLNPCYVSYELMKLRLIITSRVDFADMANVSSLVALPHVLLEIVCSLFKWYINSCFMRMHVEYMCYYRNSDPIVFYQTKLCIWFYAIFYQGSQVWRQQNLLHFVTGHGVNWILHLISNTHLPFILVPTPVSSIEQF